MCIAFIAVVAAVAAEVAPVVAVVASVASAVVGVMAAVEGDNATAAGAFGAAGALAVGARAVSNYAKGADSRMTPDDVGDSPPDSQGAFSFNQSPAKNSTAQLPTKAITPNFQSQALSQLPAANKGLLPDIQNQSSTPLPMNFGSQISSGFNNTTSPSPQAEPGLLETFSNGAAAVGNYVDKHPYLVNAIGGGLSAMAAGNQDAEQQQATFNQQNAVFDRTKFTNNGDYSLKPSQYTQQSLLQTPQQPAVQAAVQPVSQPRPQQGLLSPPPFQLAPAQ